MNIVIERGKTVPFEELPPLSIALDGYVQGPNVDPDLGRFSFDHHDKCVRMITEATCKQVLTAMHLGLNPEDFTAYINDVDADTVLSLFILQNPQLVDNPFWRRVVDLVGAVDAHGPAGFHDSDPAIFGPSNKDVYDAVFDFAMAPERDARKNKTYGTCDLTVLFDECYGRFQDLRDGIVLWTAHGKPDERTWTMVRSAPGLGVAMVESDHYVVDLVYAAGYPRVVTYCRQPDGTYAYSLFKKSDLVSWNLGPHSKNGSILHHLRCEEPGWGGGSTAGGAPRNEDGSRSRLDPDHVWNLVLSHTRP